MPGGSLPARWLPLQQIERADWNPALLSNLMANSIGAPDEVWANDRYQVIVRYVESADEDEPVGPEGLVWLSIHSHDRGPMRNWRHLQQMKNEVCGDERWAVEVFPPEEFLADSANEYHLYVLPEGSDIPFAFHEPLVSNDEQVEAYNAADHKGRQEPWEEGLTTGRGSTDYRSEALDAVVRPGEEG